ERVRPTPARAQQRAVPPVLLELRGVLRERRQAVVPRVRVVPAVAGVGLVRDVPEEGGGHVTPPPRPPRTGSPDARARSARAASCPCTRCGTARAPAGSAARAP